MTKPNYRCLLLVRVSTTKGAKESEGPALQLQRGLACAKDKFDIPQNEVLVVNEVWSGRDEDRPTLDQAFELVKTHQIKTLLVNDIDRLTRAGVAHYEILKRKFRAIDCHIYDVKGIIQPDRNTLIGSGGQLGDDFAYDWSVFAASEKAEVMEAQMAKDEARKILGRTIPAQIQNVQAGRTNRAAPYGYANSKTIDQSGKPQPSKTIIEAEAYYVRKLFEGAAAGTDIRQLCDDLNAQGFRSRPRRKWNQDYSQVLSIGGQKPLCPWTARKMIERPVYAGFACEKWTHDLPVKANHDGIVSLSLWNQANEGHWQIIKDTDSPTGWRKLNTKEVIQKRDYQRARADFPFKPLLSCSTCGKPIKAGYSTSRNGTRYGYYHCARGHKQVSAKQADLHDHIRQYLGDLRFTPEVAARFETHLRELWAEKVGDLNRHLASANEELSRLRQEADALIDTIKHIHNPTLLRRLEQDYDRLFQRIKLLEAKRDEREFSEADMTRAISWARHFVEHLDELVLDADDEGLRSVFWSLIFERTPTLAEIENRTAPLSLLVRLKDDLTDGQPPLVHLKQFRKNQIWQEILRWGDILSSARIQNSLSEIV